MVQRASKGVDRQDPRAAARTRVARAEFTGSQVAQAVGGRAQGLPAGFTPASILSLQRAAGNRAVCSLVQRSPLTVQRKGGSFSGLKKAVGVGKTKPGAAAAKAEKVGATANTRVATVTELKEQVGTLESATKKLVKAHQPGDQASQMAAFEVNRAARHILGNLPDQGSKASRLLGRTYPAEVGKLRRIIDDTQLILDEVRVANTRRQAENIYMEAGRASRQGAAGGLTKLSGASRVFDANLAQPASNPEVLAHLKEKGFSTYRQAFEDAIAKTAKDSRATDERTLLGLQPELFVYHERASSRDRAASMGLSSAELAAIQVFTAQDYRYINPATANDRSWLSTNFWDLVDEPNKKEGDWLRLQQELSEQGMTLRQREALRKKELDVLQEEGTLHAGVARGGLLKMPVWKGTAYRGEKLASKRWNSRFVQEGTTFRPIEPTFTWKTITSVSKDEAGARGFSGLGEGKYEVLWEFELSNGRDIERLSVNRKEREVALLPGAEFAYGAIQVDRAGKFVEGLGFYPWRIRIKAKQIK